MAYAHGRKTYISIDAVEVKCTTSSLERSIDKHDVTVYGAEAHDFATGLKNATATLSGIYDSGASGPPAVLVEAYNAGVEVPLVRRPEGTGVGKPEETATVIVEKYTETSPVADMVTWSADLQLTSVVTPTVQA